MFERSCRFARLNSTQKEHKQSPAARRWRSCPLSGGHPREGSSHKRSRSKCLIRRPRSLSQTIVAPPDDDNRRNRSRSLEMPGSGGRQQRTASWHYAYEALNRSVVATQIQGLQALGSKSVATQVPGLHQDASLARRCHPPTTAGLGRLTNGRFRKRARASRPSLWHQSLLHRRDCSDRIKLGSSVLLEQSQERVWFVELWGRLACPLFHFMGTGLSIHGEVPHRTMAKCNYDIPLRRLRSMFSMLGLVDGATHGSPVWRRAFRSLQLNKDHARVQLGTRA